MQLNVVSENEALQSKDYSRAQNTAYNRYVALCRQGRHLRRHLGGGNKCPPPPSDF